MMRDGGGGEGDIWFIWKGPRVNRSCGTAKFPSGQLVDVCSALVAPFHQGGTRGRWRGAAAAKKIDARVAQHSPMEKMLVHD